MISESVIQEAQAGDAEAAKRRLELLAGLPVLAVNRGIQELAGDLVTEGAISKRAAGDAVHIAIAAAHGCEYLLTWNCRHIATPSSSGP